MRSDRLGLTMIAAALLVIGVSALLFMDRQRDMRLAQIDSQASALVGVLSRMPGDTLAVRTGRQGPLDLLASTAEGTGLAYVQVLGVDGSTRAHRSRVGSLPPAPRNGGPSEWFGARTVTGEGERVYKEHFAPLIGESGLDGHVRVGFSVPGHGIARSDLPVVAALALLIFALVPLFHYLLRREVRPLAEMGERIRDAMKHNPLLSMDASEAGDVQDLVRNFNRLVQTADQRMRTLEAERVDVFTHSRVLSYEKARIESVLQSLPEGVLVLDEAGSVTYANAKLGPILGVERAEIVGNPPAVWSPQPELTAFLNGVGYSRGKAAATTALEIDAANGSGSRLSVMAYPLFSPRERLDILGTLVVFSDVTAEALAKQARKDLIAQLSHELKTPLQVIGMYSEMLLDEDTDTQAVRIEAGNVIHDEVERVTALINNMLSISRIEMGSVQLKRHRTRLCDLLQDALDSVSRSGGGCDISFSLEVPPDLSAVNVDKDLMRVAINNLLTNAIKYNRSGGSVVLGARESDEEISIFVRDTGMGIPQEERARIFDRFFRGTNGEGGEISGHGLGLPLTREIVLVHLGEIEVESTVGEGSEFRIRLRKTASLIKEAV